MREREGREWEKEKKKRKEIGERTHAREKKRRRSKKQNILNYLFLFAFYITCVYILKYITKKRTSTSDVNQRNDIVNWYRHRHYCTGNGMRLMCETVRWKGSASLCGRYVVIVIFELLGVSPITFPVDRCRRNPGRISLFADFLHCKSWPLRITIGLIVREICRCRVLRIYESDVRSVAISTFDGFFETTIISRF